MATYWPTLLFRENTEDGEGGEGGGLNHVGMSRSIYGAAEHIFSYSVQPDIGGGGEGGGVADIDNNLYKTFR